MAAEAMGDRAAPIGVALVLRSELKRFGIERMLSGSDVVAGVRSHESAAGMLDRAGLDRVDVVVLEAAEVADDGGRDLVAAIRAAGAKVLVLLEDGDEQAVTGATRVRADGFLYGAELTSRTLRDALVQIGGGGFYLPARLADDLLDRRPAPRGGTSAALTARERQVLELIVEGLSNKQIARRLSMSDHNAKRIVASILAKLNCPNRTTAAMAAIQLGYVDAHRAPG
ncbi:response regulator transcription factor [Actinomadura fibrosa]|uniref:LuxR C-terminal-related transcriptional regulator n=1 Tax=Actinomadura fibrosa TaxID=111802 RepID=A0ABW2XUN3_9ACTN|nr:response regulator transcription factor [Actinomadura fibrosa]